MRAFIIRPFGCRNEINFDTVEQLLIQPAIKAAGVSGGTTVEFTDSGSIHEDMFLELAAADIVIADVSIHNANVFYELGIRHAIRRKTTVLIKTKVPGHDSAFDIAGYRYLGYSAVQPELKIADLTRAISSSLRSESSDSPVWKHLPALTSGIKDVRQSMPTQLTSDIELYASRKSVGALRLLSQEIRGARWEKLALEKVAKYQFDCEDFHGAKTTWRVLQDMDGMNYEYTMRLGNVYNRLNDLELSDHVLNAGLALANLTADQKAELYSQQARNEKAKWLDSLRVFPPGSIEQAIQSLRSVHLSQSLGGYRQAAMHDLNSYYAWINYYSLLVAVREQAKISPQCAEALQSLMESLGLAFEVELKRAQAVVEAALYTAAHKSPGDRWIKWTMADFTLLIPAPSVSVASAYLAAYNQGGSSDFQIGAVRRQLEMFLQLGLLQAQALAALKALPTPKPKGRAILFSGLMINKPGRFEAGQEPTAKEKIRNALLELKQTFGDDIFGLAGGACGGDILFHESCAELGISSRLHLCLPKPLFEKRSVAGGGPGWIGRFDALYRRAERESKTNPHVLQTLSEYEQLPQYLDDATHSFWVRANQWLVHAAMAQSHGRPKIMLLTDKQAGSKGGTFDFYGLADEHSLQISHSLAP